MSNRADKIRFLVIGIALGIFISYVFSESPRQQAAVPPPLSITRTTERNIVSIDPNQILTNSAAPTAEKIPMPATRQATPRLGPGRDDSDPWTPKPIILPSVIKYTGPGDSKDPSIWKLDLETPVEGAQRKASIHNYHLIQRNSD